jgi:hypothetical protein
LDSRHTPLLALLLLILSIAALGGLIWTSFHFAEQVQGGGQFWIQWIAVRSKIVEGISPYSAAINQQIQEKVGVLFSWAPGPAPSYTSPLLSIFFVLPFAFISNANWAHTAWMVAQFLVLLFTFLAMIRVMNSKPPWYLYMLMIIISILSLRTMGSWFEGSMMIWVFGLVIAVLLAIQVNRYELAGFLLALTLIQPQSVILFVILVLIWAGSLRKQSLLIWFFSTLVTFLVVGIFIVPDWPLQYLRIIWNYDRYFAPGTPGAAFHYWFPGLGSQMGWVLTALMILILLVEWWLVLRREFRWFLWTAALTFVLSQWIGIPSNPDQTIILNFPLFLMIMMIDERWKRSGKWVALVVATSGLVWEWGIFYSSISAPSPHVLYSLMFPIPFLYLIGLYWVKWSAIRPPRLLIEDLRASETN